MLFTFPLVLLVASLHQVSSGCTEPEPGYCPTPCDCYFNIHGGVRVDCSRKLFNKVPHKLPQNTEEFLFNYNNITSVESDSFDECKILKSLDLSDNRIDRLLNDSFTDLVSLQVLRLNGNELRYDQLPGDVFRNLGSLVECHLQNNNRARLQKYPTDVISSLKNVRFLSIDAFPNVTFGIEFAELTQLTVFHVYGGLTSVTNQTFAVFHNSSVTELSLKTNYSLRRLEPESFRHFSNLETLDLGFNQYLGFEKISEGWWGLQYTKIKKLILTRIIAPSQQAARVEADFYRFLNLTNIEVLHIDKNNIVEMEPLLSVAFPNLTYLDMSFNRMANIGSLIKDIFFLVKLKYFDCSRQAKRFVNLGVKNSGRLDWQTTSFKQTINKKLVETDNNDLHVLTTPEDPADSCFSFCKTPRLPPCKHHDPTYPLESSATDVNGEPLPPDGTWCIVLPPRLEIINLTESVNVELDTLPPMVFIQAGHLKLLKYRLNGIKNLLGPFIPSTPVNLSLDFSENELVCLSPDFAELMIYLGSKFTQLNFAGNNLAAQLECDKSGKTFSHFADTTSLDLSRNRIKALPAYIFNFTTGLQALNLSRNSLREFGFEFAHMKRLVELDLSYNLIATVDAPMLQKLSAVFNGNLRNANLSIDLTGNPLQCSCETLPFLRWLNFNRGHMTNFEQYACWSNGTFVKFAHLNDRILVDLDNICSQRLALILSASLLALTIVVIASSVFVYRHRWEVRYYCLWLTHRSKMYRQLVDETEYRFDAFVVYAAADAAWVCHQMVPHLENSGGRPAVNASCSVDSVLSTDGERRFQLCIHERDFIAGENIFDNIWTNMNQSRKVVLVISPNFLRSNYCYHEMNLARVQSVEKGRNLFVPIILEQPEFAEMNEGLQWIVRKLTYIEWPKGQQPETDRTEFWHKVREALADCGLSLDKRRN